jgi:glycosyltransferase involved in cell wall biosynthesis
MMNMVSVIIPVFNADRYLREALESVLGQKGVNDIFLTADSNGNPKDSKIKIIDESLYC